MSIRTFIIDDDFVSIEVVKQLCEDSKVFEVIGHAQKGLDAINFLSTNTVDLIFLDIRMPDLNGFELFESLTEKPLCVVISSDERNAVTSFKYNVVDFLLKPISVQRFAHCSSRVQQIMQNKSNNKITTDSLFVKKNETYVRIKTSDITWVQSQANYCTIYTLSNKYTIYSSLNNMLENLDSKYFCRVHRSHIVNITHIDSFGDNMVSIGEQIIPMSKTGRKEFEEKARFV